MCLRDGDHFTFSRRSSIHNSKICIALQQKDIFVGRDEFLQATTHIILFWEQGIVWSELCRLRERGRISNWKADLFVTDCGSSVGWLSIGDGIFPCLRPGNKYILLQHGVPKIAHGLECLAVQCICPHEVNAFKFRSEDDALLQGLAGNVLSANITLTFLVASFLAFWYWM